MNDTKALIAVMLFALAKLCRFNAFMGAIIGTAYGMIASVFEREFLGLGPTQITLLGAGCFIVFFAASLGLVAAGNGLIPDAETTNDSQA